MHNKNLSLSHDLRKRITAILGSIPNQYIYITTATQSLVLMDKDLIIATYAISTSKFGIGNREGSFKTPLGIHRIVEKIGDGATIGTIFKDRMNTGVIWSETMNNDDNLILTRILRLEGLEWGINKGTSIDSYARYIYIHGTNKEHCIGTPNSHGCICMKNSDIVDLYNRISENTLVIIA